VHGAAFDGVDRALFGARIAFQPALEHGHQGGLASAHGSHEHQDALAHIQPSGGGGEVLLHDLLQGLIESENLRTEEAVLFGAPLRFVHACRHNHVVHAGVRQVCHLRVFGDNLQIVRERAFPVQRLFALTQLLCLFQELGWFHVLPVSFLLWIASKSDAPRAAVGIHEALNETGDTRVNRREVLAPSAYPSRSQMSCLQHREGQLARCVYPLWCSIFVSNNLSLHNLV
jgi:hypothetical protein